MGGTLLLVSYFLILFGWGTDQFAPAVAYALELLPALVGLYLVAIGLAAIIHPTKGTPG